MPIVFARAPTRRADSISSATGGRGGLNTELLSIDVEEVRRPRSCGWRLDGPLDRPPTGALASRGRRRNASTLSRMLPLDGPLMAPRIAIVGR